MAIAEAIKEVLLFVWVIGIGFFFGRSWESHKQWVARMETLNATPHGESARGWLAAMEYLRHKVYGTKEKPHGTI